MRCTCLGLENARQATGTSQTYAVVEKCNLHVAVSRRGTLGLLTARIEGEGCLGPNMLVQSPGTHSQLLIKFNAYYSTFQNLSLPLPPQRPRLWQSGPKREVAAYGRSHPPLWCCLMRMSSCQIGHITGVKLG